MKEFIGGFLKGFIEGFNSINAPSLEVIGEIAGKAGFIFLVIGIVFVIFILGRRNG